MKVLMQNLEWVRFEKFPKEEEKKKESLSDLSIARSGCSDRLGDLCAERRNVGHLSPLLLTCELSSLELRKSEPRERNWYRSSMEAKAWRRNFRSEKEIEKQQKKKKKKEESYRMEMDRSVANRSKTVANRTGKWNEKIEKIDRYFTFVLRLLSFINSPTT